MSPCTNLCPDSVIAEPSANDRLPTRRRSRSLMIVVRAVHVLPSLVLRRMTACTAMEDQAKPLM